LIVLAILGVLFGVGAGLLSSLDLGRRAAQGLVQNVLRSAHNSALARRAPARVRIDRAQGRLLAEAMQVIGTWQFETHDLEGAFGIHGSLLGGEIVGDGYLGKGLSFAAAPRGSTAVIPVHTLASFDLSLGFALELALRTEGSTGVVLNLGGAVGVDLEEAGALSAWFVPRVEEESGRRAGGPIGVESAPGLLAPDRWYRVQVTYDRARLELALDGAPVASTPSSALVWSLESPLQISDARRGFRGTVDNLVLSAVDASMAVALPGDVRFGAEAPAEIVFAPGGGLDRRMHSGPVAIALEFADGNRAHVQVGLYGTVE
jgi:hypothetical protein